MRVLKKQESANASFKISNVKCDEKWIADVGTNSITISCLINGIYCEFPFDASRWGMFVNGAGIDCNTAIFPRPGLHYGERVPISAGGTHTHYALYIPDSIVVSAPKENQKDFRFHGTLYSTAPIVKAFKPALLKLYSDGNLTETFLKHVNALEASSTEKPLQEDLRDFTNDWRSFTGYYETADGRIEVYRDGKKIATFPDKDAAADAGYTCEKYIEGKDLDTLVSGINQMSDSIIAVNDNDSLFLTFYRNGEKAFDGYAASLDLTNGHYEVIVSEISSPNGFMQVNIFGEGNDIPSLVKSLESEASSVKL